MREDTDRVELSAEIDARLSVRRTFYRRALIFLAVVVGVIALATTIANPSWWSYMLVWFASTIVGTAAVLYLTYLSRKSSLYEKAGRTMLGLK